MKARMVLSALLVFVIFLSFTSSLNWQPVIPPIRALPISPITVDDKCSSGSDSNTTSCEMSLSGDDLVVVTFTAEAGVDSATICGDPANLYDYNPGAFGSFMRMYVYYLLVPASGSCTVTIVTGNPSPPGPYISYPSLVAAAFLGTVQSNEINHIFETENQGGAKDQGETYDVSESISAGTTGRWEIFCSGVNEITDNSTTPSWGSLGVDQHDIAQNASSWTATDIEYKNSRGPDTLTSTVTGSNTQNNLVVYTFVFGLMAFGTDPPSLCDQPVPGYVNLIANCGFETGTTARWSVFDASPGVSGEVTSDSHSGVYALNMTEPGGGSNESLGQSLNANLAPEDLLVAFTNVPSINLDTATAWRVKVLFTGYVNGTNMGTNGVELTYCYETGSSICVQDGL